MVGALIRMDCTKGFSDANVNECTSCVACNRVQRLQSMFSVLNYNDEFPSEFSELLLGSLFSYGL